MSKKKRGFKDFLDISGVEGVKKVAVEYAIENDTVTFSFLSEKYNLSISGLKKLVDYAIVNCVVSYKTALFIKDKAHRNQVRHCKTDVPVTSSDRYYNELFLQRLEFVKNLDDKKVTKVVDYFLKNSHLSAKLIAESLGFSLKELNIILKKSIIFNIVDDETVSSLKKISLRNVNASVKYRNEELFERYYELRDIYKFLNYSISQILYQLEVYDDFASASDEIEQPKQALEKKLQKLQTDLHALINFL